MSIAEVLDMPVTRQPLVPPSPPRAPETMTFFGRMVAMRESAIGTWGQRAYEEDIIQGRFFGHSSFILNTPDAIRHVLVDNYENYTRTPAGIRVIGAIMRRASASPGISTATAVAWCCPVLRCLRRAARRWSAASQFPAAIRQWPIPVCQFAAWR